MENSPGASPIVRDVLGVRSSPKTSSVRDAAGDESPGGRVPDAAPRARDSGVRGSSTSNHSHSGRSASATSSAGAAASLARNAARANLGRTGMSRNTIWICCRRRVEVLMARNAASLASFFALAAATRSRIPRALCRPPPRAGAPPPPPRPSREARSGRRSCAWRKIPRPDPPTPQRRRPKAEGTGRARRSKKTLATSCAYTSPRRGRPGG